MEQSKQSTVVRILILAVIIFSISGWAYWRFVFSTPEHVFNRMLSTALTTPSVTKTISQSQGEQKLDQTVQLTTQPQQQVHSRNVLDQGNDTVVTTESVAQPKADFVRYNSIQTKQKNAEGKDFDFSKVVNRWGKLVADEQTGDAPQLYNQTILGVVPTAVVPRAERGELLQKIKKLNVYKTDYTKVKKEKQHGRSVYTYDVSVDPASYITMLQSFTKSLGMKELDDINPAQYAGSPALKFNFSIDVLSGQLIKVVYQDSNRSETYGSYGAQVLVNEPSQTMGLDALQSRLRQVQ